METFEMDKKILLQKSCLSSYVQIYFTTSVIHTYYIITVYYIIIIFSVF